MQLSSWPPEAAKDGRKFDKEQTAVRKDSRGKNLACTERNRAQPRRIGTNAIYRCGATSLNLARCLLTSRRQVDVLVHTLTCVHTPSASDAVQLLRPRPTGSDGYYPDSACPSAGEGAAPDIRGMVILRLMGPLSPMTGELGPPKSDDSQILMIVR